MIRFPDRTHPAFEQLCAGLQLLRKSAAELRLDRWKKLFESVETQKLGHTVELEHANRAYRRASFRRRRGHKLGAKASAW